MKKISFVNNVKKTINVLKLMTRLSKSYVISFVFRAISDSILPYVSIFFTYKIIDGIIMNSPANVIMANVWWMISLTLVISIIGRIAYYTNVAHGIEMNYRLDEMIAKKTYELDYKQLEDNDVMQLIEKAKEGCNGNGGITLYTDYVLTGMLSSILSIIYGAILLSGLFVAKELTISTVLSRFVNNPLSGFVLLLAFIIPLSLSFFVMKKDNKYSYDIMMKNIDGNRKLGYFYQIIGNYKYGKDIRIFGMKDMIYETMTCDKYSVESNWRGYSNFSSRIMALPVLGNKILSFIVYMYVGIKAYYGLITVGNVVMYVGAITLISTGITAILERYAKMHLYNNYLENYFVFLNLKTEKQYGIVDYLDFDNIEIEFKDIDFTYPNQKEKALNNINLKINTHEKLAIVGLNGAGKTTLIKLLCRLYEPSKGEILINGIKLTDYSKEVMDKLYSVVFQDYKLFSYSIKDNVASKQNGNVELVNETIEKSGMKQRVEKMEKGIETLIYQRNNKEGVEISGGEAQKLSIARALYKSSPIVILDEPTAELDPKSEAEVYEKFQHLVEDKTTVFISHRMSSCKFCDRIIVMDNGEIVEHGDHVNLVNGDGLYKKMWTAQAKYYHS